MEETVEPSGVAPPKRSDLPDMSTTTLTDLAEGDHSALDVAIARQLREIDLDEVRSSWSSYADR